MSTYRHVGGIAFLYAWMMVAMFTRTDNGNVLHTYNLGLCDAL